MDFDVSISRKFHRVSFHCNYSKRENIEDDFWDRTKACKLMFFSKGHVQVQQHLEIQTEGTRSQIKRLQTLADTFDITNSLSIFYEIVLKKQSVFSVILNGQKQELALDSIVLSPRLSGGWLFLGLPSLFLPYDSFVPLLNPDPGCR